MAHAACGMPQAWCWHERESKYQIQCGMAMRGEINTPIRIRPAKYAQTYKRYSNNNRKGVARRAHIDAHTYTGSGNDNGQRQALTSARRDPTCCTNTNIQTATATATTTKSTNTTNVNANVKSVRMWKWNETKYSKQFQFDFPAGSCAAAMPVWCLG